MILYDARLYGSQEPVHLLLQDGLIRQVTRRREDLAAIPDPLTLELNGATVLPGFINSHDHLDFNLYPALGNPPYSSYVQWGKDIQSRFAAEIHAVQQVPQPLQVLWGQYKNVLNGFTTVVNHGARLAAENEPAQVYQDCDCLHSPAFEKNWRLKLNRPFRRKPVVIHAGEGTDKAAHDEISALTRANFFRRTLIAVHGVAMDAVQARSFAALVWCPASNYFSLGKTADIAALRQQTRLLFGTDSTLTASWHAAEHFALAKKQVRETELLEMLTSNAAALWKLPVKGTIAPGMEADILVCRSGDPFDGSPYELVLQRGKVQLLAQNLLNQLPSPGKASFEKIILRGAERWVPAGLAALVQQIRSFYPGFVPPFHPEP